MYQFSEAIKIVNRKAMNLNFHSFRLNNTRKLLLGCNDEIDLNKLIVIPDNIDNSVYKCRITYNQEILSIEFLPYTMKLVKSLKLVFDDTIDYSYKSVDRSSLESLYAKRGECDDIIIIKNKLVTDSSYSNLIFKKDDYFFTPKKPLLKGTKRAMLIRDRKIVEAEIEADDIWEFDEVRPINAMIDIEDAPIVLPVNIFR